MSQQRTKYTKTLATKVFDLGIELCLGPINFLLRNLPYPAGVIVATVSILFWSFPIVMVASLISNIVFTLELFVKLFRR